MRTAFRIEDGRAPRREVWPRGLGRPGVDGGPRPRQRAETTWVLGQGASERSQLSRKAQPVDLSGWLSRARRVHEHSYGLFLLSRGWLQASIEERLAILVRHRSPRISALPISRVCGVGRSRPLKGASSGWWNGMRGALLTVQELLQSAVAATPACCRASATRHVCQPGWPAPPTPGNADGSVEGGLFRRFRSRYPGPWRGVLWWA